MNTRSSPAAEFPAGVSEFLKVNPGYTTNRGRADLPHDEAYYRLRVLPDWEQLRAYIPRNAKAVLDIGCGIAGIDLMISRHLRRAHFTLIDKDDRRQSGQIFNVLDAARQFLIANGVPANRFETMSSQSPGLFEHLEQRRFDVIISLRSLGYMFPYDTYADILPRLLNPGGRIILDVHTMDEQTLRNSTDENIFSRFAEVGYPSAGEVISRLEREIGPVVEIDRWAKSVRLCIRRRKKT